MNDRGYSLRGWGGGIRARPGGQGRLLDIQQMLLNNAQVTTSVSWQAMCSFQRKFTNLNNWHKFTSPPVFQSNYVFTITE